MAKAKEFANEFLTREQVAERLHCSESTVKKMVREGQLPEMKVGKRLCRYRAVDLENLANSEAK